MESPTNCPIDCPNRKPQTSPKTGDEKGDGLNLFGIHFDPVELMLHLAVIALLGVPAVRSSSRTDFDARQGLEWFAAIAFSCAIVRVSPTDRVNAYLTLWGKPPGSS